MGNTSGSVESIKIKKTNKRTPNMFWIVEAHHLGNVTLWHVLFDLETRTFHLIWIHSVDEEWEWAWNEITEKSKKNCWEEDIQRATGVFVDHSEMKRKSLIWDNVLYGFERWETPLFRILFSRAVSLNARKVLPRSNERVGFLRLENKLSTVFGPLLSKLRLKNVELQNKRSRGWNSSINAFIIGVHDTPAGKIKCWTFDPKNERKKIQIRIQIPFSEWYSTFIYNWIFNFLVSVRVKLISWIWNQPFWLIRGTLCLFWFSVEK